MEKIKELLKTLTTQEASSELLASIKECNDELVANEKLLADKDKEIGEMKQLFIDTFKGSGSKEAPKEENDETPKSFAEMLQEQIDKERK